MASPTTAPPPSALASHPHHDHGDDDDNIAVHLRRVPFTFVWWFALLAHAGCAAFLCSTTAIYVFLGGINMIYYNKLLGSTLRWEMGTLGYVFVAIAALHFLEMLRMIWFSIRARKLTFSAIHRPKAAIVPTVPVSAGGHPAAHVRRRRRLFSLVPALSPRLTRFVRVPPRVVTTARRIGRFLIRCKTKLIHRKHGVFGLESPYFNALFLLRETAEIASQSYQMYQCSMFISSAWINSLFLGITVLNCWSTPVLQHALAHYNALERAVCLALDGVLDAVTCMVIPVIIVAKYVRAFDATLLEFPIEKLTDPEWFTAMILENRMLFAMNKTDLVTTLMPHYSLFGCIRKAKQLVSRLPTDLETVEFEVTYINSMRVLVPKRKVHPDAPSARPLTQHGGEMPGWKRRLVHAFFVGWGTTVLVVHLRARHIATQYKSVTACTQQLRPWFAKSFMCASYEFDCAEQGNVATLVGDDLTAMDASTLSSLVIANCPALVVPDEIQRFSGLLKIMVYNSTIVSWPTTASLNNASHASLISISVVATQMAAFPDGLQAPQPSSLQDVRFAQTNLESLPVNLARNWRVSKISFEACALPTFPSVFRNLRVDELSLAGNQFSALDESLGNLSVYYQDFVLSDNAFLTALPSTGLPRGTKVLSIENTGIAELPTAITSPSTTTTTNTGQGGPPVMPGAGSEPVTIYAHNTPLCAKVGGVSDGDNGATSSNSNVTLYCTTRDPNGVARFPLAWTIERFRPV